MAKEVEITVKVLIRDESIADDTVLDVIESCLNFGLDPSLLDVVDEVIRVDMSLK